MKNALLRRFLKHEGPTWGLTCLIYAGWAGLTFFHAALPLPALLILGAWTMAWHSSLQHELLHGHPTRDRRITSALGFAPLSLWLPYARYRDLHLAHHRDPILTDPGEDPESAYVTAETWASYGPARRALAWARTTFAGRMLLGPLWGIAHFLIGDARQIWTGDRGLRRTWAVHGLGVVAVLIWVIGVCDLPLWLYLFGFVYGGFALSLIRSYAEHRAAPDPAHRIANVENAPIFGLLFLYNNLHTVHHRWPHLPWYAIPRRYRRHRAALNAANGGLVYQGYADIVRRFLVTPHDAPVHPGVSPAPGSAAG